MYERALDCGIDPHQFWENSPAENYDLMSSYYRKERQQQKIRIQQMFIQAEVIARYIFPKEGTNESPHPWEYYPELFREERLKYEQQREEEDLTTANANRHAFAREFNRRRQQGG